jgi:outer membrane protein TolC
MYLVNGEAVMTGVADSGKDALGVMVSLSLPVWFGDQAARVAEAKANRTAALGDKKAHLDRLQADLADAVFRERDALRVKILYDEELLPQATRAMETAEQWYRAEPGHFTDFLEARGVFYSFSLARARAEADHFQAVARIEQLIGAPLAPLAVVPEVAR